jgi:hypothetical protein
MRPLFEAGLAIVGTVVVAVLLAAGALIFHVGIDRPLTLVLALDARPSAPAASRSSTPPSAAPSRPMPASRGGCSECPP